MTTGLLITADYVANCDCKSTSEQLAHDRVKAETQRVNHATDGVLNGGRQREQTEDCDFICRVTECAG